MSECFAGMLPEWTFVKKKLAQPNSVSDAGPSLWTDQTTQIKLVRNNSDPDGHFQVQFSDLIRVDVHVPKRTIVEQPIRPDVTQATRDHFLADQVLPRILGHLGHLVLHAAAIRIEDEAILLLGKSGAGKSTLAASFDNAGSPLMGDDATVIAWQDEQPSASAVYPSLRLFPDSIEELCPESVATSAVAHYSPKMRVSIPVERSDTNDALPIRAIFALGDPPPDSVIHIRRKSIADACMALVENSFTLDPTDADRAAGRLQQASRLAREVAAFDLCYPHAYSRLAEVRQAIIDTLGKSS